MRALPIILAVALSCAAAPTATPASASREHPLAALPDVAERSVQSVVNVSTTRVETTPSELEPLFRDFFRRPGPGPQTQGSGSGVIIDASGIIVTNNHVVEHAKGVTVTLNDGKDHDVEIVGTDPKSDLAVLRMVDPPDDLVALPFAEGEPRLGEVVLAIGNPFGVGQTVTMGIVSATGRANMGIVDYEDFIQTDAAINPGNSGGALVDQRGRLVGINTAIVSRSGGNQGIGIAIPATMARPIVESLLDDGTVERGWLGVAIQDVDDDLRDALDLTEDGVLISDVMPNSPAERAGLTRGDVVVSLDGTGVEDVRRFRNRVAALGADHRFTLEVVRDGRKKTLKGTFGLLDDTGSGTGSTQAERAPLAGLQLDRLDAATRRRVGAEGVLIRQVTPGSAAAKAGLRAGDVVLEVDRQPVTSPDGFHAIWKDAKDAVPLLVYRGESTIFVVLRKGG